MMIMQPKVVRERCEKSCEPTMRSPANLIVIFAMLLLGEVVMGESTQAGGPVQSVHKLSKKVDVTLDYLLYLPPGYESQKAWPLILFLHGAGERGSDIEQVKVEGLPKLIEHGKNLPFIVVSPQCPAGDAWVWKLKSLSALIDEIAAQYKVDQDRIYVTGLSMGGFGTWALAAYAPERFAAIIPICGGGELTSVPRLKRMPVWAFHGAKDDIVPIERSREMVDALTKVQGKAKLTVYPELGHHSWKATYDNPEIYEWLLERKRPPPAKKGG
jgi:predicted peptidase